MRKAFVSSIAALAVSGALFAATTQSKTTKKRAHPKATTTQTASRTSTASSGKATKARSKTTKTAARPVRSYQQAPTPDRYQEIQQALAAKGYFQGQVNGQWGPDSVDALKRFQADQNLMPDGKISSLSLIAMGLGPKRLTAQTKPASSPTPAPAVSTPAHAPSAQPATAPPPTAPSQPAAVAPPASAPSQPSSQQ